MSLTVTSRLKVNTLTSAYLNLTISVMAGSVDVILLPLIIYFNLCLPHTLLYVVSHLIFAKLWGGM